jgi:DNA-binding LacI/PurR family transcriptional regulator
MSRKSDSSADSSAGSQPGLRQIAAAAGVSAMTVSRVLRGSPHVSADAKERVMKAAGESGYRRDPAMAKLMVHLRQRKKSRCHAAIAALTTIPGSIEPHPIRLVREGARRRAESLGYRLELFRLKSAAGHNHSLGRILAARGIEGVLLLQMVAPVKADDLLDWENFSVVAATSSIISPDFVRIGANYYHNARVLCAEIAARGFRRIGFAGTRTFGIRTNDAFVSAVLANAMERDAPRVRPLVCDDFRTPGNGLRAWLAREKPDAIIACAEEIVTPIQKALAAGPRLRTKIPVFCTSVDPASPICAGMDERHELVGHNAIEVLTGMINRNEKNVTTAHVRTLVEGRWLEPGAIVSDRSCD